MLTTNHTNRTNDKANIRLREAPYLIGAKGFARMPANPEFVLFVGFVVKNLVSYATSLMAEAQPDAL